MLHRMITAPAALAHYALGTCYVLAQLALYERTVRSLQADALTASAH